MKMLSQVVLKAAVVFVILALTFDLGAGIPAPRSNEGDDSLLQALERLDRLLNTLTQQREGLREEITSGLRGGDQGLADRHEEGLKQKEDGIILDNRQDDGLKRNEDGFVPYKRTDDGLKRNEDGFVPYKRTGGSLKRNEDGFVPYKRENEYKRNEDGFVPYKRADDGEGYTGSDMQDALPEKRYDGNVPYKRNEDGLRQAHGLDSRDDSIDGPRPYKRNEGVSSTSHAASPIRIEDEPDVAAIQESYGPSRRFDGPAPYKRDKDEQTLREILRYLMEVAEGTKTQQRRDHDIPFP